MNAVDFPRTGVTCLLYVKPARRDGLSLTCIVGSFGSAFLLPTLSLSLFPLQQQQRRRRLIMKMFIFEITDTHRGAQPRYVAARVFFEDP